MTETKCPILNQLKIVNDSSTNELIVANPVTKHEICQHTEENEEENDGIIRYLAYASDIGEALRPIIHLRAVQSTYAVSWIYVIGDVARTGYNNSNKNMEKYDLYKSVVNRMIFQSTASILLPYLTIHSAVHYSKKLIFKPYIPQYVKWGPTMVGFSCIPFLPFMWDHPTKSVCDKLFSYL